MARNISYNKIWGRSGLAVTNFPQVNTQPQICYSLSASAMRYLQIHSHTTFNEHDIFSTLAFVFHENILSPKRKMMDET